MAADILNYLPITNVPERNDDGSPLTITVKRHGLLVVGGFALDPRLAGVSTEEVAYRPPVSPPIPDIFVHGLSAPLIGSANTAVPYNIARAERATEVIPPRTQRGQPGSRTVLITMVFPAILGRVALFVPAADGRLEVMARSVRDDGMNAMARMVAKSYELQVSVPSNQTLKKLTYRISADQPFFDVWSTHTLAEIDVLEDDLVIWAGSDTSPNANVIGVTILDGFQTQVLFNERFDATLVNPRTNQSFMVGSLLRVDRILQNGRIRARFNDVTGSIMALRLNPSIEVVTNAAYPTPPSGEDLAYFEVHTPVTDRLVVEYPDWLRALMQLNAGSWQMGMVGNWPREILQTDVDGLPLRWNEIQIFCIEKSLMTNVNVPFGTVEAFANRAEMHARRELLTKQM